MDFFLKVLTPLLVVGGWIVVYKLQALQARRKLLREVAEKARDAVEELQVMAIKFHTSKFDGDQKLGILLAMTRIEKRYKLFPQIASGGSECAPDAVDPAIVVIDSKLMVALRRAITLEHFDVEEEPLPHGAQQVQGIMAAGGDLISDIDRVIVAALD